MNILLLNCNILVDKDIQKELNARGHRVHKAAWNAEDSTQTMEGILSRCPEGFVPDATVVWSADYQGIPEGIEKAPGRTIIQVNDYNVAFSSLLPHLKRFDTIWTDRRGVGVFSKLGYDSFIDSPMYPYAYKVPDFERPEKDIDVVFVGSLNHAVQWERSLWLRRLANLGRRYKILITGYIFGEEYYRTLARGKIIFNQGIRREMNMRCFEAPALDGLLVMEQGNLESHEHFPEGKGAVYYDETNFEDKIEYYLSHEEEREKICATAKETAARMYRSQVLDFVAKLEGLPPHDPAKRRFESPQPEKQLNDRAVNLVYRSKPGADTVALSLLEQAVKAESRNPIFWNNLALVHLRQAKTLGGDERFEVVKKAADYLSRAVQCGPKYLPARVSLGNLCSDLGLKEKSEKAFAQLRDICQRPDLTLEDFEGETYPNFFEYFRMANQRVRIENAGDPARTLEQLALLFHTRACEALGTLKADAGDLEDALNFYLEGQQSSEKIFDPLPTLFQRIADLTWLMGDDEASVVYGERFDQLCPLEVPFWEMHVERMVAARRFSEAFRKSSEYAAAAKNYSEAFDKEAAFRGVCRMIQVGGKSWETWERALTLDRAEEQDQAYGAFKEAQDGLAGNPGFSLDYGKFLLRVGRHQEALTLLEIAKADPSHREEADIYLREARSAAASA